MRIQVACVRHATYILGITMHLTQAPVDTSDQADKAIKQECSIMRNSEWAAVSEGFPLESHLPREILTNPATAEVPVFAFEFWIPKQFVAFLAELARRCHPRVTRCRR